MRKLVIDLGHGGYDPGAVGKGGTKESEVVLKIGKYLESMLKEVDLDVRFTRLSDKYVSLGYRVEFANNFGADYFLSIHINSASNKSVRGVEVWEYSMGIKKLDNFSNGICEDISKLFNIRNRGIKLSKELSVLKHTKMPAALVEVDFISNVEGEKVLKDSNNIKAIALAIRNNLIKLFELEAPINDILYKVCIGAYRDKNNALNQVKIAKEKGFKDAYII